MNQTPPADHFQGKSVVEHLRYARSKGAVASAEIHGTEISGALGAGSDACRDTAVALLILWGVLIQLPLSSDLLFSILFFFSIGWFLWKTGRSALLGWSRLERLHRVIEEERWEIEHHREQERLELTELYAAKGFSGKLLEEVIDVLMADDNRLLRVMLEEELGLTLHAYEHPLKQAYGAAVGALLALLPCLFAFHFSPAYGLPCVALLLMIAASGFAAKKNRNRVLPSLIWNFALGLFVFGAITFLLKWIKHN